MKNKGINDNYNFGISDAEEKKMNDKFGKNYSSINFELNPNWTPKQSGYGPNGQPNLGSLVVGGKYVKLTFSEINKVIQTLEDAKVIANNSYRLAIRN